jgi:hypothetical protein
MASFMLQDVTTWVAGYDFTTDLNQVSLSTSVDDLDATTFGGGGFRARRGGLRSIEASYSGFWQSATTDAVDPQAFTQLGTIDQAVTISYDDAEASTAYMFQGGKFSYSLGGQIGEILPFDLDMMGSHGASGLVRGQITKAKGTVSATGASGTGVNLGNVATGQYLYATFHVFGTPGTTITAVIQSDDNAGFSSATNRITFGPITTAGGTWGTRVAGPLTETHYRLNVTAITGTFTVAAAIGIGS